GFGRYALATPATPHGIIDLELAGSADAARRVITAWRCAGVLTRARPNLWLDMVWIACYTVMMISGCLLAARAFAGGLASAGLVVAGGQLLAGALDYVENVALLRTLSDDAGPDERVHDTPPRIAAWCARMKLRLLTLGLVYMVLGGAIALFS